MKKKMFWLRNVNGIILIFNAHCTWVGFHIHSKVTLLLYTVEQLIDEIRRFHSRNQFHYIFLFLHFHSLKLAVNMIVKILVIIKKRTINDSIVSAEQIWTHCFRLNVCWIYFHGWFVNICISALIFLLKLMKYGRMFLPINPHIQRLWTFVSFCSYSLSISVCSVDKSIIIQLTLNTHL